MQDAQFGEKLYTSTEVAQIIGVSLRSIYRYLDENKIHADVKTATGRHRFTKQNINDFLHPSKTLGNEMGIKDDTREDENRGEKEEYNVNEEREENKKPKIEVQKQKIKRQVESIEIEDEVKEEKVEQGSKEERKVYDEPVDWLARFRQAAEKYKMQEQVVKEQPFKEEEEVKISTEESTFEYYRSGVGGLKEIAQSLDKSAKNASLDYGFTMNAGLSLHKPIKPFSLIHSYIRPRDRAYFEKVLQLTPSTKEAAQLCLITSNDAQLYNERIEMHGLYVVSDRQLKLDLLNEGETDLANEIE